MNARSENFGAFLTNLSENAGKASSETLGNIKKEFELQQQERIKRTLQNIHSNITSSVQSIRDLRRRIAEYQSEIKRLEQRANDVVSGKEEA